MNNGEIAFIIPARGGSKGIPGKNIKDFCGKPLIAWTIQACLDSKLGDVFVSSDDTKILEVSEKYGARGILRPPELATDTSSSEDAIIHALNTMTVLPKTTFFMQCTSPWINSQDIIEAHNKWKKDEWDSMIFAKQTHNYYGIYFGEDQMEPEKGEPSSVYFPDTNNRLPRQQMNTKVIEVGAYVFSTRLFMEMKNRQCGLQTAYVIDRELPPEIDSLLDWEINEKYFDIWRGL